MKKRIPRAPFKNLWGKGKDIPVKAAAAHMGLCKNVLRLPLTPMEKHNEEKLIDELERLNITC